ncbi:hypothetical protein CGZ94_08160 [Enemella evansiae]|uniref:DUF1345 domain-containing protein n=1 Tax=Enemella evansiae TaxID=2016499 RepID=A0A255GFD1_9ACTN|nr:hypothetical protein CGZ94_08160 [Enemella evansiae]
MGCGVPRSLSPGGGYAHRVNRVWRLATLSAEVLLAVLGLAVVVAPENWTLITLFGWNLVAFLVLVVGGIQVRRTRDREVDELPDASRLTFPVIGLLWAAIPLLASMIGMTAAITVVLSTDASPGEALANKVVGVITMIQAWLILHATYALRYSWWYAQLGGRGLQFSETERPHLVDFLYFSFTVGTSFATSDVNITDRRIRWQVLVHSVLGFFYNAVVLAVAFKLLTGG